MAITKIMGSLSLIFKLKTHKHVDDVKNSLEMKDEEFLDFLNNHKPTRLLPLSTGSLWAWGSWIKHQSIVLMFLRGCAEIEPHLALSIVG